MVNVLLFLLMVMWPQSAQAQTSPQPPDAHYVGLVTPTYATGTTLNVAATGTPPANASELADIPTTESGWTTGGVAQCLAGAGGCPEAKFRTTISGQVKILYDDPIRNYSQPGQSHCHTFFGNLSANAYSTYASLRQNARSKSVAAGGPLNGTAYWFPCVIKTNPFGDGKNYAVKPSGLIIVYYKNDPPESVKIHRLLLGLRYVGGMNMDDPNQTWLQARLDVANAASGYTRYTLANGSEEGTIRRWTCDTGSAQLTSKWLKNSDNSDPFNGQCIAGKDLWMQFEGPQCWDGQNTWVPGGYKHVIPKIWDSHAGGLVCPNGWYQIPTLTLQIHFSHNGFSDYGNWRLSSDDMAGVLAGRTMRNGESFHTDWFNAWDRSTISNWLINCIGIGIEGGTARQCDGSAINNTTTLVTGNSPTRTPQVQGANGGTTTASQMFLLPPQSNGPLTLDIHGH